MSEQYMPTTEQVRTDYVLTYTERESSQLMAGAAFDRWLAAHDREVKAATEAATRAAVAAEIRAMYPEMSHHVLITERRQALYDGMREAARIAERSRS